MSYNQALLESLLRKQAAFAGPMDDPANFDGETIDVDPTAAKSERVKGFRETMSESGSKVKSHVLRNKGRYGAGLAAAGALGAGAYFATRKKEAAESEYDEVSRVAPWARKGAIIGGGLSAGLGGIAGAGAAGFPGAIAGATFAGLGGAVQGGLLGAGAGFIAGPKRVRKNILEEQYKAASEDEYGQQPSPNNHYTAKALAGAAFGGAYGAHVGHKVAPIGMAMAAGPLGNLSQEEIRALNKAHKYTTALTGASSAVGTGLSALALANLFAKEDPNNPDSYVKSKARLGGKIGAGLGAVSGAISNYNGMRKIVGSSRKGALLGVIPGAISGALMPSILGGAIGAGYGKATEQRKEASAKEPLRLTGRAANGNHFTRNAGKYGAGAALLGAGALGYGALSSNDENSKEASDMSGLSLYEYASLVKEAAEQPQYDAPKATNSTTWEKVKNRGTQVTDHLKRNKGKYGIGIGAAAGVGAALAAYNQFANKEASYNDQFMEEYEEVLMAKQAAEELYADAMEKLAFAEDLYDEADFVCKVAEDIGAGIDVATPQAMHGSPISAALGGIGTSLGAAAGAVGGTMLAGKLGPKMAPAFYAAHPGLAMAGGALGAAVGATAPAALNSFIERHRQNRAMSQAQSMAMQNQ